MATYGRYIEHEHLTCNEWSVNKQEKTTHVLNFIPQPS
jgi:hypothetical protein